MELERVAAVLRPRRPMEAVDLGFAFVRTWARPLWVAWGFTVVPVCAGILIASSGSVGSVLLGALALWWLRPLLERVPVWVLSRALFGATPALQEVLRELPRLYLRRLPLALLVHRFHYARSMVQPVTLLEGEVPHRRERERRLTRDGGATAFLVLVSSGLTEILLTLAILSLVVFFTPGELLPDLAPVEDLEDVELGWLGWAARASWLAAYSITGPLHAAAGFALYLNRRVRLEGWDIELVFRKLGARILRTGRASAAVALALAAGIAFAGSLRAQAPGETRADATSLEQGQATAQDTSADPAAVIREVLDHEDFARETTVRRLDLDFGDGSSGSGGGSELLEMLGYALWVLMWAAGIVVATALIVLLVRALGLVDWQNTRRAVEPRPVTHLFGLDLRPQSLPDDVAAEALALWRRGEAVAALGLLYRAAISRLIEHDGLRLEPSDTESDCLRRARGLAQHERADYFGAITRAWLLCAYSSARPATELVEDLCARWAAQFERGAA